ncbi:MAG: folate-binding protein [Cyanobacteria bacterium J06638_22]
MHQVLRDQQTTDGAHLSPVDESGVTVPLTFDNDAAALQATQNGVALYDRTHWGRIRVSDGDRLRFLHNQTTNRFEGRQPGEGCDTVFVTSTARTLDLATAYMLEDAVLLLVSPGKQAELIAWMDRYIFFADKVKLEDLTAETATFTLIGPDSEKLLESLGGAPLSEATYGTHQEMTLAGIPVRVAVGNGVAIAGYTLIVAADQAADLWRTLVEKAAVPMGETVWESLRIAQGRPVPGRELTEEFNPLEAGLWHTISLDKGCYIGQETIARLHTYRGVKQQLWGVALSAAVEPGTPVVVDGKKAGLVTSTVKTAEGDRGLAYLRTKALEPTPDQVQVGDATGTLIALPFVSHDYP